MIFYGNFIRLETDVALMLGILIFMIGFIAPFIIYYFHDRKIKHRRIRPIQRAESNDTGLRLHRL